jgi:AcrR family transcriptional regulator
LPASTSDEAPHERPARTPDRRTSRWAGLAAEDRRSERRTLLLDAAFELLGTEGWAGTTVRAVCHDARLNPRYFYESFDDLDALIVAVYDRLVAQLAEEVRAAVAAAGDDPREHTRAAIGRIVGFVDEDRRRARVLYVEALGNEALNRRRIETGYALVAGVEQYVIERHGPLPPGEQIGRIGAAVLVGGTSELIMAWLDGRIEATPTQLVDDATALFLALGEASADLAARRASG